MKWIQFTFIKLLFFYKKIISPIFPPACRFTPTCSDYLILAIEKKGILKGLWLGIIRLSKCHPFNPGGIDYIE